MCFGAFPLKTWPGLGKFRKTEIKELALSWGYDELVKKSESYEICFIPDNDYRSFLKRKVDNLEQSLAGGDYILTDGTVIGRHNGYPFYTIGQRKGLDIALGKPMFVVEIDANTNRVVLGEEKDLQRRGMLVKNINLQKYASIPSEGLEALTKIRYKDKGAMSIITPESDGTGINTVFYHGVNAIAPGQSAVWYEGDDVIGGGHIYRSFDVE